MIGLFCVILALLHVSECAPKEEQCSPINHLLDLLPIDEFTTITNNHLKNDPNFVAAINYFQTPDWQEVISRIRDAPDWQKYKQFLKDNGIDLDGIISRIELQSSSNLTSDSKPDLSKFLTNVKVNLTIPLMTTMSRIGAEANLEEAKVFQKIFDALGSDESKMLLEKAMALPEMRDLFSRLFELKLNAYDVLGFIYTMLGWSDHQSTILG